MVDDPLSGTGNDCRARRLRRRFAWLNPWPDRAERGALLAWYDALPLPVRLAVPVLLSLALWGLIGVAVVSALREPAE